MYFFIFLNALDQTLCLDTVVVNYSNDPSFKLVTPIVKLKEYCEISLEVFIIFSYVCSLW